MRRDGSARKQASEPVDAEFTLGLLGAAIEARRGSIRRRVTVALMLVDGRRFTLDSSATPVLSQGVRGETDVQVLCNARGLEGLFTGTLNPERPDPDHIFLCRGDRDAFVAL